MGLCAVCARTTTAHLVELVLRLEVTDILADLVEVLLLVLRAEAQRAARGVAVHTAGGCRTPERAARCPACTRAGARAARTRVARRARLAGQNIGRAVGLVGRDEVRVVDGGQRGEVLHQGAQLLLQREVEHLPRRERGGAGALRHRSTRAWPSYGALACTALALRLHCACTALALRVHWACTARALGLH